MSTLSLQNEVRMVGIPDPDGMYITAPWLFVWRWEADVAVTASPVQPTSAKHIRRPPSDAGRETHTIVI